MITKRDGEHFIIQFFFCDTHMHTLLVELCLQIMVIYHSLPHYVLTGSAASFIKYIKESSKWRQEHTKSIWNKGSDGGWIGSYNIWEEDEGR